MAKILDGKALSQRLMGEYKARIEEINRNDSICLAIRKGKRKEMRFDRNKRKNHTA